MIPAEEEPKPRLGKHVATTAGIAAFFIVAVILVFVIGQSAPPSPTPSASPTPQAQTQSTLLVQVTLGRAKAASLLVGTGQPDSQAVLLDLPQDLLLADGPNYTPLLDANLSLNPRLTSQAAQNTLGVRVDGGWRLERKALAGVVDSVGSVQIDLAAATEFLDDLGQPVLSLPAGPSQLDGPQASWYAIGTIVGEDPIAGIQARATEVFVKAVVQLPDDDEAIAAMLTSLGSLSTPLNGASDVSEQLVSLRAQLLAAPGQPVSIPMRASELTDPVVTRQEQEGGEVAAVGAFRVADYPSATPVLRQSFASSPRTADVDGPPRVLVWNATGEPLASHVAILELSDADFVPLSAGTWSSVQATSQLNGVGYSLDGQSFVAGASQALGLVGPQVFGDSGSLSPVPSPSASAEPPTMPPPDQTPWADVDVVIGSDYTPCPIDEPQCLEELK